MNETLVEASGALGIAVLGSVLVETGSYAWPLPVAACVAALVAIGVARGLNPRRAARRSPVAAHAVTDSAADASMALSTCEAGPPMTALLDSLPAMDVAGRAGLLRKQFADAEIDALLVTFLPNVRYLTSFTGSAGMLLVTNDALVFTTDGRYRTQSAEQLGAAGVEATIEVGATISVQRDAIACALDPVRGSGSKRTRSRGRSSGRSARR